jgi:transcription termination factor NusB
MSQQLSLSFELILLFDWFLKEGRKTLQSIVKEAVTKNISEKLENVDEGEYSEAMDQLHQTVLDFIQFLEETMSKELETSVSSFNFKDKIEPLMQSIDDKSIDSKTLWLSIQKTKKKFLQKPDDAKLDSVEQELLRELLKNWKPTSNEPVN